MRQLFVTMPFLAWHTALVRSNALVVVKRYRENVPVLRHEALQLILWRSLKLYGHPEEFFMPCDKAYPE